MQNFSVIRPAVRPPFHKKNHRRVASSPPCLPARARVNVKMLRMELRPDEIFRAQPRPSLKHLISEIICVGNILSLPQAMMLG